MLHCIQAASFDVQDGRSGNLEIAAQLPGWRNGRRGGLKILIYTSAHVSECFNSLLGLPPGVPPYVGPCQGVGVVIGVLTHRPQTAWPQSLDHLYLVRRVHRCPS